MIIEICANSVQSAVNAQLGGADRIELCQNLSEGGTTPSYASISFCVNYLKINTFVLIRPRAGNFNYSDLELEIMKQDIAQCKKLGVKGIVVGFLSEDGSVDVSKTKQIVEMASPMEVTFHRAFDRTSDWEKSLEDIIHCGCHRILTSGLCNSALEGVSNLQKIISKANNRIIIVPGGGISHHNALEIASITSATELHASCKDFFIMHHNVKYSSPWNSSPDGFFESDEFEINLLKKLFSDNNQI